MIVFISGVQCALTATLFMDFPTAEVKQAYEYQETHIEIGVHGNCPHTRYRRFV